MIKIYNTVPGHYGRYSEGEGRNYNQHKYYLNHSGVLAQKRRFAQ